MQLATIKSNQICVRHVPTQKSIHTRWAEHLCRDISQHAPNLHRTKSSFSLSQQSRTKLFDSINYLHTVSTPRTINCGKDKLIYNFKSSFVTLTLPSAQRHSDQAIKSCLNNFLTTIRTVYGLKNYVWKAELQQNENIHFHLVFDIFIHHHAIRYYWNKAIEVLGYVSAYQQRFSQMSLTEYASARRLPVFSVVEAFQANNRNKWRSPPSESVVSIHSSGQLSIYLAKYLVKAVSKRTSHSDPSVMKSHISIRHLVRIRKFGRTWGRSQSLSKITYINCCNWQDLKAFILSKDRQLAHFIVKTYDYCTIYYFRPLSKCFLSAWFTSRMRDLAISTNYAYP